jgi:adenylate cyclase
MADDAEPLKRRLAVILAADVAGYSRLVAVNEEGTLRRFGDLAQQVEARVTALGGRVFNTAGDAILAEFDSAVMAVRAADEIQTAVATAERDVAEERAIALRIGIAVGDVVVRTDGDLLGDGVNIAARLQTIADPGGIVVADDIQRLVGDRLPLGFTALGPQQLKNLPRPVEAYRVGAPGATPSATPAARWWRPAAGIGAIVLAILGVWAALQRPAAPVISTSGPGRFDTAKVPLVTDATRQRLVKSYVEAGGAKALAISNDGDFIGVAVNAPDETSAGERAKESCERDSTATHRRPCFVYAVGDRVLVDAARFPLPLPGETPAKPAGQRFGVADTPLAAMQQGRRLQQEYPAERRPKALAIGSRGDGVWGAMSTGATAAEASRRALEFCGFRAPGPCVLYAVGDDLMTRPPQTKRIIGALTFAGDKSIPAGERARLLQIYAAGDWQAMARGANGTWHAIAGQASELAAIEAALTACRQADRDCRLYAVGRFLVAD